MTSFKDAVTDWLTDRRAIGRTISTNTYKAYQSDIERWRNYLTAELGEDFAVTDVTRVEVKTVLARFHDDELGPATRKRLLSTLKSFYRWLVEEEVVPKDVTIGIPYPRIPERLPVAFGDGDVAKILDAAWRPLKNDRKAWPELDVMLVLLCGGVGLRSSEAATVRIKDFVAGDNPLLRVTGKGSKQRNMPLDDGIVPMVHTYLEDRSTRGLTCDPDETLLVRPDGKPLTRYTVGYRVVAIYRRAGIAKPDGEAAHALRHTFAESLLNNGVPLDDIQHLLGHASIATTGIYLRSTAAQQRSAIRGSSVAVAARQRAAE